MDGIQRVLVESIPLREKAYYWIKRIAKENKSGSQRSQETITKPINKLPHTWLSAMKRDLHRVFPLFSRSILVSIKYKFLESALNDKKKLDLSDQMLEKLLFEALVQVCRKTNLQYHQGLAFVTAFGLLCILLNDHLVPIDLEDLDIIRFKSEKFYTIQGIIDRRKGTIEGIRQVVGRENNGIRDIIDGGIIERKRKGEKIIREAPEVEAHIHSSKIEMNGLDKISIDEKTQDHDHYPIENNETEAKDEEDSLLVIDGETDKRLIRALDFTVALVVYLLEYKSMGKLFDTSTSIIQQYVDRFDFIFEQAIPDLFAHFHRLGYEPGLYVQDWFTTFFTYSLNVDCIAIVWDLFITAGINEAPLIVPVALLSTIKGKLLEIPTLSGLMEHMKPMIRNINESDFRVQLHKVCKALVFADVFNPEVSTLDTLFNDMISNDKPLTGLNFDATYLMAAVQKGNEARIEHELMKYQYPLRILEYAFMRSILLGNHLAVMLILHHHPNLVFFVHQNFTPLHVAALLGHARVAHVLLQYGFDPQALCRLGRAAAAAIGILLPQGETYVDVTPLDISYSLLRLVGSQCDGVSSVILGEDELELCTKCERDIFKVGMIEARCKSCKLAFCVACVRKINNKNLCQNCTHYSRLQIQGKLACGCKEEAGLVCSHQPRSANSSQFCECQSCLTRKYICRGVLHGSSLGIQSGVAQVAQDIFNLQISRVRNISRDLNDFFVRNDDALNHQNKEKDRLNSFFEELAKHSEEFLKSKTYFED